MQALTVTVRAGLTVVMAVGLALAASPAHAATPEYSLEGTCAVVKLHPDDVSEIASQTAYLVALETSGTASDVASAFAGSLEASGMPVTVTSVGVLDAVDLGFIAILGSVGLGVVAGRWGKSHD